MKPPSFARPGVLLLAGLLLAGSLPAAEAAGGFSATLSSEQKTTAGLTTLTAEERSVLDQLVADDLADARHENLSALDGTFVARQTEAGRKAAGLDRLTPAQLAKLNELVAAAITAHPTPKERPRLKDSDVLVKNRAEIHGSVTVAYGWGAGGRSMRAGSLWLDYYDPESRLGLSVGLSTASGGGFGGYYPDYYAGYGYGPGYFSDPGVYFPTTSRAYLDASYRGENFGAEAFAGDGACFRPGSAGGLGGHSGWRHH